MITVISGTNRRGSRTRVIAELYKNILQTFPNLKLIASGGVTSAEEIKQLKQIGCDGAIIGKAIYEGKIKLEHLTSNF